MTTSSAATQTEATEGFWANSAKCFKKIFSAYSSKDATRQEKALAIIIPLLGLLMLVFLGLLIALFLRKRYLKSKLNKTPSGTPADDGPASPDLIQRPSSAI